MYNFPTICDRTCWFLKDIKQEAPTKDEPDASSEVSLHRDSQHDDYNKNRIVFWQTLFGQ